MMKTKIIKAVAYARYSSDNQRDESIDAQLRGIEEYAKQNQIILIDEYIDRALTATTDNRPAFLKMIEDSSRMKFDIVIVHKLDRFARNREDSAIYKMKLKKNGVRLYSVTEKLDDSPESVIMESVLEGMAEYYSKNLSREVKKGMHENALKCIHTGGLPPLGFDVDKETRKLVINEREAEAVKIIFNRFAEGRSYRETMQELNDMGYKTKKGNAFATNGLHEILKNMKYKGVYVFNRSAEKSADGKRNNHANKSLEDMIVIEGGCPQIVSAELFDLVGEKMKTRKHTQKHSHAKEDYLLRGVLKCGICGGSYVGTRRVSKGTKSECRYGCNKRYRTKSIDCNNMEISKPYIERVVLEKLSEYVFHEKYTDLITAEYNSYLKGLDGAGKSRLEYLYKEIKRKEQESEKVIDLLIQSSSESLLNRLDTLDLERKELSGELSKLEYESSTAQVTRDEVKAVLSLIRSKLKEGKVESIQNVVQTYIKSVKVWNDRIEIIFNFFPSLKLDIAGQEKSISEPKKEGSKPLSGEPSSIYQLTADECGGGEGALSEPLPPSYSSISVVISFNDGWLGSG